MRRTLLFIPLITGLITACGGTTPSTPAVNLSGDYRQQDEAIAYSAEYFVTLIDANGALTGSTQQVRLNGAATPDKAPIPLKGRRTVDGQRAEYSAVVGGRPVTYTLQFDDLGGIAAKANDPSILSVTFKKLVLE